jgi:hypothetical protein
MDLPGLKSKKPAGGLTVRQWCDQNQVSIHTYNYWKHVLKEELVNQMLPNIVPVTLPVLFCDRFSYFHLR